MRTLNSKLVYYSAIMIFGKPAAFAPPWHWGIFRRDPCSRLLIDDGSPEYEPMTAIYQALKAAGFRETYWQFVYPGQIGGVVKTPRGTLIELHVRFFERGMIYAEMEVGRSVLLHFLNRRYYINEYLIRKFDSKLTSSQLDYLRISTARYKACCDNDWPEWTLENRFITRSTRMQIRFLTVLADWRVLALIMLASVASSVVRHSIAVPLVAALMILVYLLAPKRAQ
jgi:hypothetical protein